MLPQTRYIVGIKGPNVFVSPLQPVALLFILSWPDFTLDYDLVVGLGLFKHSPCRALVWRVLCEPRILIYLYDDSFGLKNLSWDY